MQMRQTVDRHYGVIILALVLVILAMVVSCTFDSVIPVCHWIFRCG